MRTANIDQFTNGWMIGDFEPALFKTPLFEFAHHFCAKGNVSTPHTHWIATEYNYIVSGELIASGIHLKAGDMFIYNPGETATVTFLEDTNLIIIKTPSLPNDKHLVQE